MLARKEVAGQDNVLIVRPVIEQMGPADGGEDVASLKLEESDPPFCRAWIRQERDRGTRCSMQEIPRKRAACVRPPRKYGGRRTPALRVDFAHAGRFDGENAQWPDSEVVQHIAREGDDRLMLKTGRR